jgi:UDP-galactopyranose mutase
MAGLTARRLLEASAFPFTWRTRRTGDLVSGPTLQQGDNMASDMSGMARSVASTTLVCFSHLRWDFVYQRPQHLMSRFAREYRVLYVEEPVYEATDSPWLEVRNEPEAVQVLVPHLPPDMRGPQAGDAQRRLLDAHLATMGAGPLSLWYYTPMSLSFSKHLPAELVVYDCMDELSAFRGAPAELVNRERALLARADVVFTGGLSRYEAKRALHANVHAFPSSVDVVHFAQARRKLREPADQVAIPRPRMGFYGVLDERFDVDLIDEVAAMRPDWQIVLVGPVVKIDPAILPQRDNIHYLGGKTYSELPLYLAGWDVALMPFALNESTRYISPTKTPEYLAAGRAVVSSPIADVVRTYGSSGMVRIAATAQEFVQCIEAELLRHEERDSLCKQADAILGDMSWDATWQRMSRVMRAGRRARVHNVRPAIPATAGVPEQGVAGRERTGDVARSVVSRMPPAWRKVGGGLKYDYLIVGAGFAGSVLAERLAAGLDKKVLVIDRRPHIGGNAYDFYNEDGILIHKYGPHIFHTNSEKVLEYLSQFTEWRPYEHRVLAHVDGQLVPMPINLTTLSRLYGRSFTPAQAQEFLAARAVTVPQVRTSEDVVVSTVGRELYEKFFRGYTRKQWGLDPSDLDKSVTARVPTRTSTDDRYFMDTYQCMPLHGYTRMFDHMLDHPNITVATGTSFADLRDAVSYGHLVYCGPIDEFFDYRYGRLPYRSLRFRHVTLDQARFQPAAVVNYPSEDVPYTRITEYKYLTGQHHAKTSLTYEFPTSEGDPYYPVPRPENAELFRQYQALADDMADVTFVGRLATYRYYNMDQVVAQALSVYERIAQAEYRRSGRPPVEVVAQSA